MFNEAFSLFIKQNIKLVNKNKNMKPKTSEVKCA